MRIAFMSDGTAVPPRSDFPKIHEVFDDRAEIWTGYPLKQAATPYRPTLYLRERCRLADIFQEVHALLLTRAATRNPTVKEFANAVETLAVKMEHWHDRLPLELRYVWPMCIAVWELQSVYPIVH